MPRLCSCDVRVSTFTVVVVVADAVKAEGPAGLPLSGLLPG